MPKLIDTTSFIGKTFNRLTIISYEGRDSSKNKKVKARCICGNETMTNLNSLRSGHTKSCGCFSKETVLKSFKEHNLSHHPLYSIWKNIRYRCTKKNKKEYINYGARGISVCKEWSEDFITFYNWCIKNGWQKGLEIDRRENNGNYEPDNCRIVKRSINCQNKRTNLMLLYKNEIKPLIVWCNELNLNYKLVNTRISRLKWSVDKAFNYPAASR